LEPSNQRSPGHKSIEVTELYVYPVKSCRGFMVDCTLLRDQAPPYYPAAGYATGTASSGTKMHSRPQPPSSMGDHRHDEDRPNGTRFTIGIGITIEPERPRHYSAERIVNRSDEEVAQLTERFNRLNCPYASSQVRSAMFVDPETI
jgi:hypothetical protein